MRLLLTIITFKTITTTNDTMNNGSQLSEATYVHMLEQSNAATNSIDPSPSYESPPSYRNAVESNPSLTLKPSDVSITLSLPEIKESPPASVLRPPTYEESLEQERTGRHVLPPSFLLRNKELQVLAPTVTERHQISETVPEEQRTWLKSLQTWLKTTWENLDGRKLVFLILEGIGLMLSTVTIALIGDGFWAFSFLAFYFLLRKKLQSPA